MGKSSFARRLEHELGPDALTIVTSGNVKRVTKVIGSQIGAALDSADPVSALADAPAQHSSGRVVIVLDEIEKLIEDRDGLAFLDNLREAYEQARGRLGVVVLGGTRVRDLLLDKGSPFLRIAGPIHVLTGLSRDETAQLMREPLGLEIPDQVIDAFWVETAGHPWLLQMFMECAVARAERLADVAGQLPAAISNVEGALQRNAFPLWWENMQGRGQEIYRSLIREPGAVFRERWINLLGNDPRPWLDVLASTGLVELEPNAVIARGTLFRRWAVENHPEGLIAAPSPTGNLEDWLDEINVGSFERLVVRALAIWARTTIEFPAAAVRLEQASASGNGALQPEAFFQIFALSALLQHQGIVTAEPEALSMRSGGRSDIKVRSCQNPSERACVEFKIYGRKDEGVVEQLIGYSAPEDAFGVVVSVDRAQRPLRDAYKKRCFAGLLGYETLDCPAGVFHPALLTVHPRLGASDLRVWHLLLQLRDA